MKGTLKKLLSSGMVLAALTLTTQSAFASDGYGDTIDKAVPIKIKSTAAHTISDSNDVDWYKYDNRTGESIVIRLESPAGKNYDFEGIYISADGSIVKQFRPGKADVIGIQLGLGDQVYIKVYGNSPSDYDPINQYKLIVE